MSVSCPASCKSLGTSTTSETSPRAPRRFLFRLLASAHGVQLLPKGDAAPVVAAQSHPRLRLRGVGDAPMAQEPPDVAFARPRLSGQQRGAQDWEFDTGGDGCLVRNHAVTAGSA